MLAGLFDPHPALSERNLEHCGLRYHWQIVGQVLNLPHNLPYHVKFQTEVGQVENLPHNFSTQHSKPQQLGGTTGMVMLAALVSVR